MSLSLFTGVMKNSSLTKNAMKEYLDLKFIWGLSSTKFLLTLTSLVCVFTTVYSSEIGELMTRVSIPSCFNWYKVSFRGFINCIESY